MSLASASQVNILKNIKYLSVSLISRAKFGTCKLGEFSAILASLTSMASMPSLASLARVE
jgi:hypothetical protein